MKRFLTFLFICVFVVQITIYAKETEEPKNLYAQSAVLMDAKSGRVLFAKNGEEILANASTTKILTCIIALEEGKLDDVVTASSNAASQPKVHLGMSEGEQFYLKDLLYSLMLESHNDSAVAIAEHLAVTTEKFAEKMNLKATEIGCRNTYFITPNGLDATDDKGSHSTTATDLAKIMSYCIIDSPQRDAFLELTQMANYTFSNLDGTRSYTCSNKNAFLYMFEGAISGKTGFTGKAGYCYVGAVERDERTYVVALLACGWPNNKNYKWKDSAKLMEYAIENYTYKTDIEEVVLPSVEVKEGISTSKNMFAETYVELNILQDEELEILCREDEAVSVEIYVPDKLNAPVKKGDVVGSIRYYVEGYEVGQSEIVVTETVKRKSFRWYFENIFKKYTGM